MSTFRDSVVITYCRESGGDEIITHHVRAWDSSLGLEACVSVGSAARGGHQKRGLGDSRSLPQPEGWAPRAGCWRARFLLEPPPVSVCQGGGETGSELSGLFV